MKAARLEDFGIREIVSADKRLRQYIKDCKQLPRAKRGRFWLEVLEHDSEVRSLLQVTPHKYSRRRRF